MDSLVHKKFNIIKAEIEQKRDEEIDQLRSKLGASGNVRSGLAIKSHFKIYSQFANEIIDVLLNVYIEVGQRTEENIILNKEKEIMDEVNSLAN